jgi:hypothetical protein
MSSNYIKEEKKKRYTKTKAMSKYKSKLNKNANPYFPKENNIGENINIKQQADLYQGQNILNENESISLNNEKLEENIKKYSYETLKVFGDLQISKETNLLTEDALEHINQMYISLSSIKMDNLLNKNGHSDSNNNNNYSNCDTSKSSGSSNIVSLELWSRPDYTKETEEAENNKKIFDKKDKIDSIKKDLRELLNSMTKDNYEIIKNKILEIIKDKIENQDKFIDIIFLKSISEESYVGVYAKLIKDLDQELPQKIEKIYKNKRWVITSFTDKLIKKCKEMMKFEEKKIYLEYLKENAEIKNEDKMKKIILGNSLLICELIKYELVQKKAACDCIDYSFNKFYNSDNSTIRNLSIQLIINFVSNLGVLAQNEEDKKTKKNIRIQKKIEEAFEKLEKIKEDENIPGYIKYNIINLIKKKENNYKLSEFEKYKRAKSKKELEEENKNKTDIQNLKEKEDINQDDINELIKNDLFKYKQLVESEGSSEKFSWEVTTVLYDYKLKKFDSILEGYFMGCLEFIDKMGNVNFQYAKDYIKEIVEYYQDKMTETEKNSLVNKIYELYDDINDNSLDIPDIFKLYEYVIEILIENGIIKYNDLSQIFETKMNNKEDSNILNDMFRNIYNNIKTDKIK